jgi:hypothetical protein
VAVLALAFSLGVVPVWQYVDAHRVPGGTQVRTATITGFDAAPSGADRGDIARFRLTDGTTGGVHLDDRFAHPDPGGSVEVYRADGRWHSPRERSAYGLVSGLGTLALCGLVTAGWFRVRRRGRLSPVDA